jgi:dTMP kinase
MAGFDGFTDYFESRDTVLLEAAMRKPKPDGSNIRQQVQEILRKKKPKDKKGLLIVFEGIDGAGKTTQVDHLIDWLKEEESYDVVHTKWNSSKIMKDSMKTLKEKRLLSPMMYCLMHAADMVLRYEHDIVPALMDNKVVVADRYIYTSMVRDKARGVDVQIMNEIYKNFREPDILFHCVLPIHLAFSRMIKEKGLSYYGTGMDLNLADNKEENYLKYEAILDKYYRQILPIVPSYHKLNMAADITTIAEEVKKVVRQETGIGKYHKG